MSDMAEKWILHAARIRILRRTPADHVSASGQR
uniref:Uncharacterized protein n=1 Tax=Myoviridae sp. ctitt1 TaxID=2825157 RepID=A0A8S5QKB7_9CAUD|nr:MAG TPA: hypothetical protein [Myoviridae sp. ctitt1]